MLEASFPCPCHPPPLRLGAPQPPSPPGLARLQEDGAGAPRLFPLHSHGASQSYSQLLPGSYAVGPLLVLV